MGYHSSEWGFDSDFATKRWKAQQMLERLGVNYVQTTCLNSNSLADFRPRPDSQFLVFVYFGKEAARNLSFAGVSEPVQVLAHPAVVEPEKACFYVTPQLSYQRGDTRVQILSDGKGRLYCEILTVGDTVPSFESASTQKLDFIRYEDFELLDYSNHELHQFLNGVIDVCLFQRGYFEGSFASLFGKRDFYFTYYSDLPEYRNLLDSLSDLLPNISARVQEAWWRMFGNL